MSKELVALTREAHKALDDYLIKVREAMQQGGAAPTEVRSVLADLEGQVLEMLSARGPTAQETDVRAVLAQLDAPEDYAQGSLERPIDDAPLASMAPTPPTPPAHLSRTAVASAALAALHFLLCLPFLTAFFLLPAFGRVAPNLQVQADPRSLPIAVPLLLSPAFGLAAMIVGFVAMAQIRQARGRLYGLGLAYFGAWSLPILWLTVLLCWRFGLFVALAIGAIVILKISRYASRRERDIVTGQIGKSKAARA